MTKRMPFSDDILECIMYRSDGVIMWTPKARAFNKYGHKRIGSVNKNGYRYFGWHGKKMLVHRYVWFLHNGVMPTLDIDHINGDRDDNRIENLRELPRHLNLANSNLSKGKWPRGVCKNGKNGFMAKIRFNGKIYYLGTYKCPDEAHDVYKNKRLELTKITIGGKSNEYL